MSRYADIEQLEKEGWFLTRTNVTTEKNSGSAYTEIKYLNSIPSVNISNIIENELKVENNRECPPDYNSGFCDNPTAEMCSNCWDGWRKEFLLSAPIIIEDAKHAIENLNELLNIYEHIFNT